MLCHLYKVMLDISIRERSGRTDPKLDGVGVAQKLAQT